MMHTLAEIEDIREASRRAIGLAGLAGTNSGTSSQIPPNLGSHTGPVVRGSFANSVPGGMGAFGMPQVRIGAAFPAVDYTWDPNQPAAPPTGEGSWLGEWLNRHVFRPFAEVGPVRYAPGDGYADYSGIASALALGLAGVGAIAGAVIIGRALYPTRWIKT